MSSVSVTFFAVLLTACAMTDEQVVEQAKKNLDQKLEETPQEPTFENDDVSFYAPVDVEVEFIDEHNYVLDRDGQVFLLFLDDKTNHDDITSVLDELYLENEPVLAELTVQDGQQVYMVIAEFNDGNYKVVTGFNGAKVTSIMEISQISDRADMMFDVVHSIEK